MGFFDLPIIDNSSRQNDLSERKLKEHLNQNTGFILRPDVPDKGCDFDAELLLNKQSASNWRFPIQLKSIATLSFVENKKFISYPFETSRLGYLMRRLPTMGIIVLYSVEEDKCFYEYCDKIYTRLMDERESDKWLDPDTVNIHIPYENILSASTIPELHKTFQNRFEQAVIMQSSNGRKYGLPSVSLSGDFKYDFNNIDHIKMFLSEYGLLLLNNYDLDILYQMITQIPSLQIYDNKDLLMIAAVAYTESALYTQSELYCNRLLSKFRLEPDEKLMLQFITLKNKQALGYINSNEFLQELKNLDHNNTNSQNKITIEINLVSYELAKLKAFEAIPESIIQTIDKVFISIKESDCSERTKGILTIWNCENLSYLISTISSSTFGKFQITESLGQAVPQEERKMAAINLIKLETRFNNIIVEINSIANQNDDKLLKAYSLSLDVKHFIQSQINYISFEIPVNQLDGFEERLKYKFSNAATAYNYFQKLNLFKEAYISLCNSLEIIELGAMNYSIDVYHDKAGLYITKQNMEKDLDLIPRPLVFPDLINRKKAPVSKENDNGMPIYKNLNDEQIENLAKMALLSFNLPTERLVHIINEMKAYRLFHQRCDDKNILILQFRNPNEKKSDAYSHPVRFVLRSNKTEVETPPNSDMSYLLSSWGF